MMRRGRPGHRRREPIDKSSLRKLTKADFLFILPILKEAKGKIILSIIWNILCSLVSILPPLITQIIIDDMIGNGNRNGIFLYTILLMSIYVVYAFLMFKQDRVTTRTAQGILKNLRETVLQRFLKLSMKYYDDNKRGELLSVVVQDVNTLSRAITGGLINIFNDIVSIAGITVAMIYLDWQLGIVTYTFIPLILFAVRKYRKRLKKSHYQIRQKVAEMNVSVEENVSGIRVAQSLAIESRNIKEFNNLTNENYKLRMKSVQIFSMMTAMVSINIFIGMALLVGFGGIRFIYGGVTIGVLIAFLQYSAKFVSPLSGIAGLSNQFLEAWAAILHIQEYIVVEPEINDPETPTELPKELKGELTLENVEFSYNSLPFMVIPALSIKSNEKIGIVGETGAGKSTFISLITRLYDVKEGSIKIDGIDIRSLKQKDLRSILAIVSQDVFLFSETIMNNIRFGRPTATDVEVIEAAKTAQSHEFIMAKPNGYQTRIGEQGSGLSGGQKQLIAYARMILAKPKIAILDEATSNIDSYTENIIQENMREVLKTCTTLVIAHRFATLQAVDRLILINNGTIETVGTHDELMESSPYYHDLFINQYSKM